MISERRVMVTGHRPDRLGGYELTSPAQDIVRSWLRCRLLDYRTEHGPIVAISGGALGTDQWFAEEAHMLGIPFELYEPFAGFGARWPAPSRKLYERLRTQAR